MRNREWQVLPNRSQSSLSLPLELPSSCCDCPLEFLEECLIVGSHRIQKIRSERDARDRVRPCDFLWGIFVSIGLFSISKCVVKPTPLFLPDKQILLIE